MSMATTDQEAAPTDPSDNHPAPWWPEDPDQIRGTITAAACALISVLFALHGDPVAAVLCAGYGSARLLLVMRR